MSAPSQATAGTSGGLILSIPVSARAIGMGEAYTAQADDVGSLYWNPAGLAIISQNQFSFMNNQAVQGLSYNNATAVFPTENGGFGTSLSYLSYGQINGFDSHANYTGGVNAYSAMAMIGDGVLLGPLSLGVNLKGVEQTLADVKARGYAADVGAMWTYQKEVLHGGTLRFGTTVRNMGSGLSFIDQRDAFPLEWRIGAALVQLADRKLNLSLDYAKQRDVSGAFYSGAEYWILPMVALRTGYAGTDQAGTGLRAGLGLRVKNFDFDYAYSAYGDLGLSHRFELSFRWGELRPPLNAPEREMMRKAKIAMREGRYEEAVLLYDSVLTLVPHHRQARRLVEGAIKYSEEREQLAKNVAGHVNLLSSGNSPYNPDQEGDLLELLKVGDEESQLADKRVPDAETNALAPQMPTGVDDQAEQLK